MLVKDRDKIHWDFKKEKYIYIYREREREREDYVMIKNI